MRVRVVCMTEGCPRQWRIREVALQHLGDGVYLRGALVCGDCGADLMPVSPEIPDQPVRHER